MSVMKVHRAARGLSTSSSSTCCSGAKSVLGRRAHLSSVLRRERKVQTNIQRAPLTVVKAKDEDSVDEDSVDEIYTPGKDDVGPLSGATGGFGGGEKGLKQFVSEKGIPWTNDEAYPPKAKVAAQAADPASPIGKGKDLIYVGKPKGATKVDDKTKYIKDDARLYPGKEDVGGFIGASGGFAGGEVGLKRFAETGDVGIREEGSTGARQPTSPLLLAFGLGGAVSLGAIISDPENLPDLTKAAVSTVEKGNDALASSGVLESPVTLYAAGAVGAVVVGGYAFTQVKKATASLVETTKNVAVTGLFGLAVVKLALTILTK